MSFLFSFQSDFLSLSAEEVFSCRCFTRPQLGPFFVLKFLRSRGLSSTVSKVHSDRKVLFEQKNGPLIAVNGR